MTRALFEQYDRVISFYRRFPEEALALEQIKRRKLWKNGGFDSFKAYLYSKPRRLSTAYAGMLIRAALIAERWPSLEFPNEGSARPITRLSLQDEWRACHLLKQAIEHYRCGVTVKLSELAAKIVLIDPNYGWEEFKEARDISLKKRRRRARQVKMKATFIGGRAADNRFVFEGEFVPNLENGAKVRLSIYVVGDAPETTSE